jgi:hypothetical protein
MPFVIVLDSADRLPRGSSLVRHELVELPAMLAGPRGKGSDRGYGGAGAVVTLTVILISETPVVVPGTLEAALALDVPFPAYSKVQATAILLRSLRVAAGLPPSSSSSSGVEEGGEEEGGGEEEFELLVAGFVNVLVASLYSSTRDVREMRRMAVLLSEKYLEPVLAEVGREGGKEEEVEEGQEGQENQAGRRNSGSSSGGGGGREGGGGGGPAPGHLALFERVRPLIQRAVHSCLHMPAEPLEKPNSLPSLPPSSSSCSSSSSYEQQQQQQHQALLRHELPKMALYLLLASFLASHVSPDTDLQLFAVKSSSSSSSSSSTTTTRGTKRTKRTATAEDRAAELQEAEGEKEGARAFSLERLLSIFTCLVALTRASGAAYANNTGTTELFAQVNTLVRHRLLLRVRGGSGELGGMKFKCNVDEGLVRVVATELEVALGQYLERGARG